MAKPHPIRRRALAAGLAALAARPALARTRYAFDQTGGLLEFSARHLGLFDTTGRFEDFRAELLLAPATAALDVTVRTAAIAVPVPGAAALLRSAEFFDVAHFPEARFTGSATGLDGPDGFALTGALTLRGITRPFRMDARLARPEAGRLAEFSASGAMRRSDFGMVARQGTISDTIRLSVRVGLVLG